MSLAGVISTRVIPICKLLCNFKPASHSDIPYEGLHLRTQIGMRWGGGYMGVMTGTGVISAQARPARRYGMVGQYCSVKE